MGVASSHSLFGGFPVGASRRTLTVAAIVTVLIALACAGLCWTKGAARRREAEAANDDRAIYDDDDSIVLIVS
jgi:hypothetical protein